MKINFSYVLVLSFTWILTASTCDKDCNDSGGIYEFVLPVIITPALDTFHVGDTIYVCSEFLNLVYERVSGKEYLLDSFRFYPLSRLIKIDVEESFDVLDSFEILLPEGLDYERFDASSGNEFLIGEYEYNSDSKYSLDFSFVPKSKGTFLFRQLSQLSSFEPEQEFPGYCDLGGSKGICIVNEHEDNNIHLLENSPDPHFNEWVLEKPEKRFYDLGGYAFVVVE